MVKLIKNFTLKILCAQISRKQFYLRYLVETVKQAVLIYLFDGAATARRVNKNKPIIVS